MSSQDSVSHGKMLTTSTGTGDLVLTSLGDPQWANFPAGLDGRYVDVEVEHLTAVGEVETGRFLYEHATTTLKRSLGGTEWSTAGVGTAFSFSVGDKLVSMTVNARTVRELVLFRGGGRTINEDVDFSAGTQYNATLTDHRHRSLKVMGFNDGALTQAMTVNLPAVSGAEWGDEFFVEKGDSSTLAVTVFGFDNSGTGTHILRRQDQYIIAKVTGTTTKKWERQRGGQQSPSAKGQDIIKATNPEDQLVTGGAAKIRNATAAQDGLMTTTYAGALDAIATGLAYEPSNY